MSTGKSVLDSLSGLFLTPAASERFHIVYKKNICCYPALFKSATFVAQPLSQAQYLQLEKLCKHNGRETNTISGYVEYGLLH